ncbi:putative carboxypeptidase S1 [Lophiotrema nucula]|uniref:Putative carboxypeptidase S1 n=1 Tax=Lophiotrema nucula TaxID=690887 RepID=A0A6A5ZJ12_9PLEO|nr:putative carboxypeptidase S1 [Lophiotrema nucula]
MHLGSPLAFAVGLGFTIFPGVHGAQKQKQTHAHSLGSIEYQQVSICETTPGVSSFSGYVHLPSTSIPDIQGSTPFNISTFFWYFSARKNPGSAPLAVYLAGGPGEASSYTLLGENGPCYANSDGNSTTLNLWSFNNEVNMLYIDHINQVGFSYDEIVDGVYDALSGSYYNQTVPGNMTVLPGRFASQNPATTTNTTGQSAKALWYFTQVFLSEFNEYHGPKDTISIWGNSYGGEWTTATFKYFQDQNDRINNRTLDCEKYKRIHLDTLGITNGCVDLAISAESYVALPFSNTYGVEIYNETVYKAGLEALHSEGGCLDQVRQCRELQALSDPGSTGTNDTVNGVCAQATLFCFTNVLGPFRATGHSDFDMGSPTANPYPPSYPSTFLNQQWVRQVLGIPDGLNHTQVSSTVEQAFFNTGDFVRRQIDDLNSLLDHGVKVALIYGDRDWKCSWTGAETLSLATSYKHSQDFHSAGYTEVSTNQTYKGGVVRQYESFSFSRVFNAGHAVSFYQPETVWRIFNRAMFGKDVATGQQSAKAGSRYKTKGPSDSWGWKNKMPESFPVECNIYNTAASCTQTQLKALAAGTAVLKNDIVVEPAS